MSVATEGLCYSSHPSVSDTLAIAVQHPEGRVVCAQRTHAVFELLGAVSPHHFRGAGLARCEGNFSKPNYTIAKNNCTQTKLKMMHVINNNLLLAKNHNLRHTTKDMCHSGKKRVGRREKKSNGNNIAG